MAFMLGSFGAGLFQGAQSGLELHASWDKLQDKKKFNKASQAYEDAMKDDEAFRDLTGDSMPAVKDAGPAPKNTSTFDDDPDLKTITPPSYKTAISPERIRSATAADEGRAATHPDYIPPAFQPSTVADARANPPDNLSLAGRLKKAPQTAMPTSTPFQPSTVADARAEPAPYRTPDQRMGEIVGAGSRAVNDTLGYMNRVLAPGAAMAAPTAAPTSPRSIEPVPTAPRPTITTNPGPTQQPSAMPGSYIEPPAGQVGPTSMNDIGAQILAALNARQGGVYG